VSLLDLTNIMSTLLIILVSLLGYIYLSTSLRFSKKIHEFQALVERLFDKKILAIQSDWGGEYQKLNPFFKEVGISHHMSCPYAHQQNGSVERKDHHIVEVGLSLLAHAHRPLKYWDEAFLAATYIINWLPSKVIGLSTPLRSFSKKNQITQACALLGVHVGQTFTHSMIASSSFAPSNMCSLGIVIFIRGSSALMLPVAGSTSPVTLCSMKQFILSVN
jgi:hypothetical protein